MVRTTPARPARIEDDFTFVAEGMRTTTRLHPRRGAPDRTDSSMGGEMGWPAGEAWPHCDVHVDSAMVPVLQLWARDVPDMPMRPGTDVFQLLWCPNIHDYSDEGYGPRIVMFWRDSRLLGPGAYERPQPSPELLTLVVGRRLVPRACVLHPERVREYPSYDWDLTDEQRAQVDAWPGGSSYESYSGYAPGTKVGGWPRWLDEMDWPDCRAGHAMEHLLTIASSEWDAASWKAWLPSEDRGPNGGIPEEDQFDIASGILLGDAGDMIVFVCYRCPDWPTTKRIQS